MDTCTGYANCPPAPPAPPLDHGTTTVAFFGQLPMTGLELVGLLALALAMIAAGVALRRAAR